MKTRLWQKASSVSSTNPSTPISPNNDSATSPQPPAPPQQQQAMQTYQNSTFMSQQSVPVQPPQYSSHAQPQFSQQQIPPPQQHASVFMQATHNAHSNQTPILGNIQSQPNNYRHPMHSSVGPPPPQHMAAQFSAANQAQHPTSMDQVLQQHLRMNYQSYGANTPFDRATWSAPHPQNIQGTQPTFSFTTSTQQTNISPYTASIHQQAPFIAANVSVEFFNCSETD